MKVKNIFSAVLVVLLTFMSGNLMAQTVEEKEKKEEKPAKEIVEVDERQSLKNDAEKALKEFKAKNPNLQGHLDSAAGYAIFPNVGKGAWILGGAAGNGIVYEKGKIVGYTELRQIDVGFQIGGQKFSEIIIFKDQAALDNFKQGNFQFEGSASAVIWDKGRGEAIQFKDGVGVALMPKAGAMAGISVGGQKFNYGEVQ